MGEKLKTLFTVFVPVCFIAATCWHISYWSTFDINPYEYMEITEILLSFAYPFVISILIGVIIQTVIFIISGIYTSNYFDKKNEKTNESKSEFKFFSSLIGLIFFDVVMSIIIVLVFIFAKKDTIWLTVPYLLESIIVFSLFNSKFLNEILNIKYNKAIMVSLTFVIAVSIVVSKERSFLVRDNLKIEITDVLLSKGKGHLKVLGKLGNTIVLANPSNTIKYFVKEDSFDFYRTSNDFYLVKEDKFVSFNDVYKVFRVNEPKSKIDTLKHK